jgi:hypothetical protein
MNLSASKSNWFEIWFAEGEETLPTHLLIVVSEIDSERLDIVDPYQANKTVYWSESYESIVAWLREDEYTLITGRMFPEL